MTSRLTQKNGYKILVVDDDPFARSAIAIGLRREGFLVAEASSGTRALSMFQKNRPDIVLLDIEMSDMDGLSLLKQLRSQDSLPIVICTTQKERAPRVASLELGADDFINKPFSPKELGLRVNTVLRRAKNSLSGTPGTPVIEFGSITVEPDTHEVRKHGSLMVTTAKEFDLLYFLARSPGVVFSRTELLSAVWDSSPEWQSEATVTEHVRRLRQKVEDDPANPKHLETIRGAGYRLTF